MADRDVRRSSSPIFTQNLSVMGFPGKEGQQVKPGSYVGRSVGVFCSGGDSQGMNSAVRAVVRMGYYLGCKTFYIKEGYQGMVDGGDYIVEATWASSSNIIQLGGTIIGSARCPDFRKREGRLKAACNLVINSITDLVCIGGDGSLTGANIFRKEWPEFMAQLLKEGKIDQQQFDKCCHMNIVGLVGSIDNDFCGTDMTIGADSALHRIVECVDAISATASSHQRAFVLEVMGRHCGYLALVGAMATESDWVFIPEWPPLEGWEDVLCRKLAAERATGQRLNIIIVSEGAIDRKGNPITATQVKDLIASRLKYDTRVTVLGHVQRGGTPSAYDRILAARMGAEAVLTLMDATPDTPASVISIEGNQIVRVPLVEGVERTQLVQKAMDDKNFDEAVKQRGRSFQNNLQTYRMLSKLQPPTSLDAAAFKKNKKFAIINIGAPACGVNSAVRTFVRLSLANQYTVLGIHDSFEGLLNDRVHPIRWMEVQGYSGVGGSQLGTKKVLANMYGIDKIAEKLEQYDISGLLIIGGFEAYQSALQLAEARDKFKALCIPMIVIPCTISNNVPGTDFSLGADTAVNEITQMCDRIKQSASGTKRRVFVLETMGGYSGYLATLSGLAAGADAAYIFEEPFTVLDLKNDVTHLKDKILTAGVQRGLVLRNELSNANYTTDFIHQLFNEEGKGVMSCRKNVLGHMQQGGVPSVFDRNYGSKMATRALSAMIELVASNLCPDGKVYTNDPKSAVLLGMRTRHLQLIPLTELKAITDFEHRLPTNQWYLKLRPLLRVLAKHKESLYITESQTLQHIVDMEEQTEF